MYIVHEEVLLESEKIADDRYEDLQALKKDSRLREMDLLREKRSQQKKELPPASDKDFFVTV